MIKRFITLLFIFILFFNSAIAEQKPLTIILDWFINPDHAPLFVALDQGFFHEEGVDILIVNPANSDDPPKLVALGKADIAITYQPELMIQVDKGLPLIRIATLIATPLNSLVVLDESPIKSIKDLKGKKIASSSSAGKHILLEGMLNHYHLSSKDIEVVNVHYNLMQALLSKKVDAASGMMRNIEVVQLQQLHQRVRVFYPEEEGMPSYEELVFVANTQSLHDPRLKAFVRALERGVEYLINHPETSWQRFAKKHPELDNALNHEAWIETLQRFARRPSAVDYGRYQRYAAFLAAQGAITKTLAVKSYAIDLHGV